MICISVLANTLSSLVQLDFSFLPPRKNPIEYWRYCNIVLSGVSRLNEQTLAMNRNWYFYVMVSLLQKSSIFVTKIFGRSLLAKKTSPRSIKKEKLFRNAFWNAFLRDKFSTRKRRRLHKECNKSLLFLWFSSFFQIISQWFPAFSLFCDFNNLWKIFRAFLSIQLEKLSRIGRKTLYRV